MDWKSVIYVAATAIAGITQLAPPPYNLVLGILSAFLTGLATKQPGTGKEESMAEKPVASSAAIANLKSQLEAQISKLKEQAKA